MVSIARLIIILNIKNCLTVATYIDVGHEIQTLVQVARVIFYAEKSKKFRYTIDNVSLIVYSKDTK